MTDRVDILIVNALKMELDAVDAVLTGLGVSLDSGKKHGIPYRVGILPTGGGPRRIALARPTRMGAVPVATTASGLVPELRPTCLAMSGVCAGNPDDVALGDVIVAETAYAYDEGKRTTAGFDGDHRQVPLSDSWQRLAQELSLDGLSTFGSPTEEARRDWLLDQLAGGSDPVRHPARERYLDGARWETTVRALETEGMILRKGQRFALTRTGRDAVAARRAYDLAPISHLPFVVHVGPIASGNAVVKDGVTWQSLTGMGVRSALGLEMEAAAIAQVAHRLDVPRWIVAKGVMDYADPKKNDKYKPFAAAASAQVLIRFLQTADLPENAAAITDNNPGGTSANSAVNVVGNVSGSNNIINQTVVPPRR